MARPRKIKPISSSVVDGKESVAVIGGGLGGCLSALMLIKQGYHVTLIEKEKHLLSGASRIAARLHRGGEYPKDLKSALDCLHSALVWKLLMPADCTTSVPPMKFLVTKLSQQLGEREAAGEELSDEEKKNALRLEDYIGMYEKVRVEYVKILDRAEKDTGRSRKELEEMLLGPADEGIFYHMLKPEEYASFGGVVGGFQSQEEGLNPEYLMRIQYALEKEEKKGNLTILTDCTVTSDKPRGKRDDQSGIRGELGDFKVYCKRRRRHVAVHASQVVQAAWSGGPAITPQLGLEEEKTSSQPLEDDMEKERGVTVYRRGMLVVDLPGGWKEGPTFVMVGQDGYMIAPYNDQCALVYLIKEGIPYISECMLTEQKPELPDNWQTMPEQQKEATAQAFLGKVNFYCKTQTGKPLLAGASNPRLMVGDTLNFQEKIFKRRAQRTQEQVPTGTMRLDMKMRQSQEQEQTLIQTTELHHKTEFESKPGLFVMYPTKATHAPSAAFTAVYMVKLRSLVPDALEVHAGNPFDVLIQPTMGNPRPVMDSYSLASMEYPPEDFKQKFLKEHPDLTENMMLRSWPGKEAEAAGNWSAKVARHSGWTHGI